MKTARELHNQAMAVSAQADRSKRRGDLKEAQKLFQKAMQLGIGAAEQLDPVGSKAELVAHDEERCLRWPFLPVRCGSPKG